MRFDGFAFNLRHTLAFNFAACRARYGLFPFSMRALADMRPASTSPCAPLPYFGQPASAGAASAGPPLAILRFWIQMARLKNVVRACFLFFFGGAWVRWLPRGPVCSVPSRQTQRPRGLRRPVGALLRPTNGSKCSHPDAFGVALAQTGGPARAYHPCAVVRVSSCAVMRVSALRRADCGSRAGHSVAYGKNQPSESSQYQQCRPAERGLSASQNSERRRLSAWV